MPFNFKYRQPSLGSDLANAGAQIAQSAKDEADKRRQEALQAALNQLKFREADRADAELGLTKDKFGYQQKHDTDVLGLDTQKFGLDKDKFGYEQSHDVTTDTETHRHNVADEGNSRLSALKSGAQARPQLRQTKDGFAWFYPDGHTSGVTDAAGKPIQGMPGQGEMSSESAYQTLGPIFSDIKNKMTSLKQPPGAVGQFALDQSRTAPSGIMGSLENILGNKAAGKIAPEYQALDQAITAFSTFLGQMVSGQAISEQEAGRLRTLIGWRTGDSPEKVATRLQEAEAIINSARIKAGRAKGMLGGDVAGSSSDTPTPNPTGVDALKKKYNLE